METATKSPLIINVLTLLFLLALTTLSVFIPQKSAWPFEAIIFFIVFLKAWLIANEFMELRQAPRFWRYLILSYIVIIPALLTLISYIAR